MRRMLRALFLPAALCLMAEGGAPGTTILNPPFEPPGAAANPGTLPPSLRTLPYLPAPAPLPAPGPAIAPPRPVPPPPPAPLNPGPNTGYGTGGMQAPPGAPPNPPYPPGGLMH